MQNFCKIKMSCFGLIDVNKSTSYIFEAVKVETECSIHI